MDSPEQDLLDANAAFYACFATGDFTRMESLWARENPVACIHPGWAAIVGRERVLESWRRILGFNPPKLICAKPFACASKDGQSGFVVCEERIGTMRLAATNSFVREEGGFRLVNHQASPIAQEETPLPPPGTLN